MNIYIKNLSHDVDDDDLKTLFAEYGTVTSAKVIIDKYTNRSRGFGFVEMENKESAEKAINELNQVKYDGRVISVSEAKPRTDRPKSGGFSRDNKNFNSNKRW